jgi:hypothetical protein
VDQIQQQQQAQSQVQMQAAVGLPNIVNWTQKREFKQIIELLDQANLITYVYTQSALDGKYTYMGEGIGYPIPYDTEYTNPKQVVSENGNPYVLPQSDPNGLFSGPTNADWMQLIPWNTGQKEVIYVEPNMLVTQEKLPASECESWSLPKNY